MTKQILFLLGPSGSGKTELSLCLARRLGCEIVSADSMLVYKGMNIGTAKPNKLERKKIKHHLIDLVSPRVNFSVYRYRKLALSVIDSILKRHRIPLVVGGGGLYAAALLKGLSGPFQESGLRNNQFRRRLENKTTVFLYSKLKEMDPVRAAQIHPYDRRRITRALEIASLSGKTPSEWYRERESLQDLGYQVKVIGIHRDRTDLYERINQRAKKMFRLGFVSEVKRLKREGFSKTAGQALGYKEILGYLDKRRGGVSPPIKGRGDLAPTSVVQSIQQHTRHFAKRQLTWLRREKEIRWVEWDRGESARSVCDKIVREFHGERKGTVGCCSASH